MNRIATIIHLYIRISSQGERPRGGLLVYLTVSISAYARARTGEVVAENLSALHDEFDPLEFRDIVRRIASNRNQIGILAFLDGSDLVSPADVFSADRSCGTDRL